MRHIKSLLLFTLTLFCSLNVQGKNPFLPVTQESKPFTSIEGRFTIALPGISSFESITPQTDKGKGKGMVFKWQVNSAVYSVTFADFPGQFQQSSEVKEYLDKTRAHVNDLSANKKINLVSDRNLSLSGNPGYEFIFENPGARGVKRTYFAGSRYYEIIAAFPRGKGDEEASIKILDSFQFLSPAEVQAVLQKRVDEATPKSLPQEPVVKRLTSDAQEEGVKGKVKEVITERANIVDGSETERAITAIDSFNQFGDFVKRISFDSHSKPFSIEVYGYLDGKKVSSYGLVRYEEDPPPMMGPPGAASVKQDTRYTSKYQYSYDEQKRLIEKQVYGNDETLRSRQVYKYEDKQRQKLYYYNDKLSSRLVETFDDKGNIVQEAFYRDDPQTPVYVYWHNYEFDAQGNWIKRTTLKVAGSDPRLSKVPVYTTYRKITYYE